MARMIGPSVRQFYYTSGARAGSMMPAGIRVPLYADVECTTPADVLAPGGGVLPVDEHNVPYVVIGPTLEVGRFQFPDTADPEVHTRVLGGPVISLYPDVDGRIDALAAAAQALNESTEGMLEGFAETLQGTQDAVTQALEGFAEDLQAADGRLDGFAGSLATQSQRIDLTQERALLTLGDLLVWDTFAIPPASGSSFGPSGSGHTWQIYAGAWVTNNAARTVSENSTNSHRAAVVDASATNVAVEAGIRAGRGEGLILRATDISNYLYVSWDTVAGTLGLMKRDAGAVSQLHSVTQAITAGRRYRLRAVIWDATVQAYLDGVPVFSFTLSSGDQAKYGSSTRYGLRASSSSANVFDSFTIRSL